MPTATQEVTQKVLNVATSKHTRSVIFLVLSIFAVLLINSLLPLIEGGTHYTEDPIEVTYGEYKSMLSINRHYSLTWNSTLKIEMYKQDYIKDHPDLTAEEKYTIEPSDSLKVNVYTKFFFEYSYWWISTIVHVISVLIIYYSFFMFLISKNKQRDEVYLKTKKEIDDTVTNNIDPTTFEPWMMYVFNIQRKISQHIANTKYLIDKLNSKTSYRVRHYKVPPIDVNDTSILSKKHLKYLEKLHDLQEQLGVNEDTIEGKKVKGFKYIHPTFVTTGYNGNSKTIDSYSQLKSDSGKISGDAAMKILSAFGLTTMFAILLTFTVTASLDKPWYWVVLNIVIKIAPMLIQIPFAYDYAEAFMSDQLMGNLIARRNIALLYLADKKKGVNVYGDIKHDRPTDNNDVSNGSEG